MAVFKCKMCGSDLYPEEGAGVVVCDLCGSEQTLPKAADDKKTALFNKANAFRMKKRFDEALKLYAEIQAKYPDEADAHWGKLLCEYGIEYVDDNKTERKIPTCNRTLSVSIFDHPEYKAAMKKATKEEGEIYKREAAEIDGYQKKILEIAKKEAPYDIFICFKELDSEGKRTKDSQLATKIYENLTKKNYKVFFSRVTLKSKVGSEYEPYIYAALQSAKVMLVLATKKEYVEAVWVRNEWSRYLGFMEADGGKSIVPCIKDIDAYDLPEALQDFQAQDMGELDFIENLTRAIDSKFGRATFAPTYAQAPAYAQAPVAAPAATTQAVSFKSDDTSATVNQRAVENFIKRAYLALEIQEFAKAEAFAEQALNLDAEYAEGYFVEVLCDLRLTSARDLVGKNFLKLPKYLLALRFADGEFLDFLHNLEEEHLRLQKDEEETERRRLEEERRRKKEERRRKEEEKRRKEEERRRKEEEKRRKEEERRREEEEKRRKEEEKRGIERHEIVNSNLELDILIKKLYKCKSCGTPLRLSVGERTAYCKTCNSVQVLSKSYVELKNVEKIQYNNGDCYIGEIVENKRDGRGVYYYSSGTCYEGEWKKHQKCGRGTLYFTVGDKYVGEFLDGQYHGYGIYYYRNGDRYEGRWESGKRNGYGTMHYVNGYERSGAWKDDKLIH